MGRAPLRGEKPGPPGLIVEPEHYRWSSAAIHCGLEADQGPLDLSLWKQYWTAATWREYLRVWSEEQESEIRRNTHTGRPLGTPGFVKNLECALKRRLPPQLGGRPAKQMQDSRQTALPFGA